MYTLRLLFLIAVLLATLPSNIIAGNHTISTTVEITETAINRYLNTQYNSTGFPRSVNFNHDGTDYTLALTLPEIILIPENAKLKMVFDVNTGTTNIYHFEVRPYINIPSNQITLSEVSAFLTDLVTVLNAIPSLPQWVKDKVIEYYNSLGFLVYPSKLIDKLDNQWIRQRALTIDENNFTLSYEIITGAIRFTVSVPIVAHSPTFDAEVPINYVAVKTNDIDVVIVEVRLYTIDGDLIKAWTDNVYLSKGQVKYFQIGYDIYSIQNVILWVLFKIDNFLDNKNTFYVREFLCPAIGGLGNVTNSIN